MFEGTPEVIDRRFQWVCKYSEQRNRNLRERLAAVSPRRASHNE